MSERSEPKRVEIRHVHTNPDGTERIEHGPALVPTDSGDDPGVIGRMISISGEPKQEVLHYAPAARPPRSYPANFPFVPHIEAWVTRFPDGEGPTGARWPCAEAEIERVLGELDAHSRGTGWTPSGPPPDWPTESPGSSFLRKAAFMRRGAELRMLITAQADGQWMLQLLDGPWDAAERGSSQVDPE